MRRRRRCLVIARTHPIDVNPISWRRLRWRWCGGRRWWWPTGWTQLPQYNTLARTISSHTNQLPQFSTQSHKTHPLIPTQPNSPPHTNPTHPLILTQHIPDQDDDRDGDEGDEGGGDGDEGGDDERRGEEYMEGYHPGDVVGSFESYDEDDDNDDVMTWHDMTFVPSYEMFIFLLTPLSTWWRWRCLLFKLLINWLLLLLLLLLLSLLRLF